MKEYTIIGAGPAGICALVKIYSSGVDPNSIQWIDSKFSVGDFGTNLSIGSSVPGNTTVESYQRVNQAIYSLIPQCAPDKEAEKAFEITAFPPYETCPLNVAAAPLQAMTNQLRQLVPNTEGSVLAIEQAGHTLRLSLQSTNGKKTEIFTKRVILATGGKAKTLALPKSIQVIEPNTVFIESELQKYIDKNSPIKNVAVIGSSHSAALATMHLLKAGLAVKQFMNKAYQFATPIVTEDGQRYTKFDNTGLKGKVALFTKKLLNQAHPYQWECYVRDHKTKTQLEQFLQQCSHAVVAIGYTPSSTLTINRIPLSDFKHNKQTTEIISADEKIIPGVFGVGIAFPLEIKSPSGEIEFAVGVEKFWTGFDEKILAQWKNYT